jgi:hypothetical protein
MKKVCKPEGFFDKGLRLANQGLQIVGTARGLYEAGQTIYGGMQAVGRLAAVAGPALAIM